MNNALTTQPQLLPERFANPLRQLADMFALPIVRRSLPMILLVGLVAGTALAWSMLASPTQKILFSGLPDADKAAVTQALQTANIDSNIDAATGAVTVGEDDFSRARILLAGQGLPKAAPGGYAILDQLPMGVSRAVEGERLRQARESELAKSIEEIDAVAEARVHLAMPESTVFVRDNAAPSASVILKLSAGRSLADAQVNSIVNLVASSVPGMKPDAVTIVDQMGALLTHGQGEDGAGAAGQARIDFQRRIEEKYRAQLTQLLTPLVGAGNFTTEVQADVDLDETQATRESYEKDGSLRAEQGNWTAATDGAPGQAPGGIPGELSNSPPPPTTVAAAPRTAPKPAPPAPAGSDPKKPGATTPGAPEAAPAAPAPADPAKRAESYARAYDIGKEISVTRGVPGTVRRLSVAVLLRDPATGKARGAREIQQITTLVQAAVGYDATRNDQVTVIARQFAGATTADSAAPWYDAGWLPIVARNVTAILIAVMVLMMGVRPLVKAILKRRDDDSLARATGNPFVSTGQPVIGEDGTPQRPPVSIEMLDRTRGYDERIGMVRDFTRDNPTRAALAVRDMIKSDPS